MYGDVTSVTRNQPRCIDEVPAGRVLALPDGYRFHWDEDGLGIEVTDYHATPVTLSWRMLRECKQRNCSRAPSSTTVIVQPRFVDKLTPDGALQLNEGYRLLQSRDGLRIDVTDYHATPVKLSWRLLREFQDTAPDGWSGPEVTP